MHLVWCHECGECYHRYCLEKCKLPDDLEKLSTWCCYNCTGERFPVIKRSRKEYDFESEYKKKKLKEESKKQKNKRKQKEREERRKRRKKGKRSKRFGSDSETSSSDDESSCTSDDDSSSSEYEEDGRKSKNKIIPLPESQDTIGRGKI